VIIANASIASTKLTHCDPADLIAASYRPTKAQPPHACKTQRGLAQKMSPPDGGSSIHLMTADQAAIKAGLLSRSTPAKISR
jgi:hypothetical protein